MTNAAVVRHFYDLYRTGDRAAAEPLVAERFVFTSPQDDRLDRATYFERCFPTAGRFVRQTFLVVTEVPGTDDVVVVYEYELAEGATWRNAELVTVDEGRLVEAQVFFGGRVYSAGASDASSATPSA